MRLTIFFISLLLTNYAIGQSSRIELANSKIYICATYFENKIKYIGLETKTILKDTIIENTIFTKFKTENFTDYSQQKTIHFFYEAFKDNFYYLLDNTLKIIHEINYLTNLPQSGTIFGKTEIVEIEYIDTRNSFPREQLNCNKQNTKKVFCEKQF